MGLMGYRGASGEHFYNSKNSVSFMKNTLLTCLHRINNVNLKKYDVTNYVGSSKPRKY